MRRLLDSRRLRELTREERIDLSFEVNTLPDIPRPKTRGECATAPRPCPWVGCRYHLYLRVNLEGKIFLESPIDPWEMKESCALDVADKGEQSLENISAALGLTRERVRQLEEKGLYHMRASMTRQGIARELRAAVPAGRSRPDLALSPDNDEDLQHHRESYARAYNAKRKKAPAPAPHPDGPRGLTFPEIQTIRSKGHIATQARMVGVAVNLLHRAAQGLACLTQAQREKVLRFTFEEVQAAKRAHDDGERARRKALAEAPPPPPKPARLVAVDSFQALPKKPIAARKPMYKGTYPTPPELILLIERGWPLAHIGREIGVSVSMVSLVKYGKCRLDASKLAALAELSEEVDYSRKECAE